MGWLRCSLALFVALLLVPTPSPACPFCPMQGQTLSKEVDQSAFVLFGALTNPRLNADGIDGTTDLIIEEVVKPHAFVKDKKTLTLPRYLPVDKESKVRFLIFCDYFKDQVDPYRGMPVKDKGMVEYLRGALAQKDKDVPARLKFFFNYLDDPDIEINTDAYKEFAIATSQEVTEMLRCEKAKQGQGELPHIRAKLLEWLEDRDKKTPPYRFGLYGYLLGLCGEERDTRVLLALLEDPQRGLISGVDGVLAGYVLLKKDDGWQYLFNLLKNPKKNFTTRYAGLRAIRFLWEERKELVGTKELIKGMQELLKQSDIADLAIEDLRKWKQWDLCGEILALNTQESHNVPIVRRAILRFALTCPDPQAKAFVEQQRRLDPQRVKDAEELLKWDEPVKPMTNVGK